MRIVVGWTVLLLTLSLIAALSGATYAAEFSYDALGRLQSVTYPGGGATGSDLVISYEYDAAGNRTETAVSNTGGGTNTAPTATLLVQSVNVSKGGSALLKNVFSASDPESDPMAYELWSVHPHANSYFKLNGVNLGHGPITVPHADFQVLQWQTADAWDVGDEIHFKASDGSAWSSSIFMDVDGPTEPEEED